MSLSASQKRMLSELFAWYRQFRVQTGGRQPFKRAQVLTSTKPKKFKAPTGGVPARDGNQPGVADCEVVELRDNNGTLQLQTTSETIKVYSWLTVSSASTGDRYGLAAVNSDGYWFVEADDCSDDP